MRRQFLTPFLVGLVLVLVVVAIVVYVQRGAHIEVKGTIQKVRTMALDDASALLVADFRFVNPADYKFIVRKVMVTLEDAKGEKHEGTVVPEIDAQRLFQYYPLLGEKYNQSLVTRTTVLPKQSMDRMIAARFEVPLATVDARRNLTLTVEEVDGMSSDIVEHKR